MNVVLGINGSVNVGPDEERKSASALVVQSKVGLLFFGLPVEMCLANDHIQRHTSLYEGISSDGVLSPTASSVPGGTPAIGASDCDEWCQNSDSLGKHRACPVVRFDLDRLNVQQQCVFANMHPEPYGVSAHLHE